MLCMSHMILRNDVLERNGSERNRVTTHIPNSILSLVRDEVWYMSILVHVFFRVIYKYI